MTIHPLPTAAGFDEHAEQIGRTRDQLLTEIANGIRIGRAAYAVVHTIIDKEIPR